MRTSPRSRRGCKTSPNTSVVWTFASQTSGRECERSCRALHRHRPRNSRCWAHRRSDQSRAATPTARSVRRADRPGTASDRGCLGPQEFRSGGNRCGQTERLPAEGAPFAVQLQTSSSTPTLQSNFCECGEINGSLTELQRLRNVRVNVCSPQKHGRTRAKYVEE